MHPDDPASDVHHDLPWPDARRRAADAGTARAAVRPTQSLPIDATVGLVLAQDVPALVDVPTFDTAAMDGWAVRGEGPWQVVGEGRAGHPAGSIETGQAVRISTGAVVPNHSGVLRTEHGLEADGVVASTTGRTAPSPGTDTRSAGEEVRAGEQILAAGTVLTPPAVGLAAAAGIDSWTIVSRPTVTLLVLGDELVDRGVPGAGQVRDALSPQLPGWVEALHGTISSADRVTDTLDATMAVLAQSDTDVVITTGGTAGGRADHVRESLTGLGGHWLVDGVAVRPGHPMKLGELPDGRLWIALPGNPLAAVSALVTLGEPLFGAISGRLGDGAAEVFRPLAEPMESSPGAHRLIPARILDGRVVPMLRRGPAMLTGLAGADVLAVVPPAPDRLETGDPVSVLPLPWGAGLVV